MGSEFGQRRVIKSRQLSAVANIAVIAKLSPPLEGAGGGFVLLLADRLWQSLCTPNSSLLTTNLSTSPYIVNYTLLIINYILPPPPS
jgi:hypothetical protein